MTSVVGLRFVVTGEAEAIAALERYKAGLSTLGQAQRRSATTFSQRVASETQSIRQQDAEARKALHRYLRYGREKEQAAARAARAVEQAAQQEARAIQRQDAEARKAYQQYLRYQQEKERAAAQAAREIEQAAEREARAQRQAAQETARLAAETEALARAYNPVMAASSVYEREVHQLNRAHQLGVLSADALETKLGELQSAYARVGAGTVQAQNFVNQFGSVTQLAGVKTNRFGMVAQQVGYQVGDFFVQIQSGTNAFVAFGQQATQLAGLLPGVVGAVVGIGISVGTMLLSMWDRTRQAAEDSTDSMKTAIDGVREKATSLANEVALIGTAFDDVAQMLAFEQIETLSTKIQELDAELAGLNERQLNRTRAAEAARRDALQEERDALQETYNALVTNLRLQEAQARQQETQNAYIEQMAEMFRNVQEAQRQVAINAAQTYQTNEAYVQSVAEAFRTMENLREEIGDAAYEALRLAGVDMASGIDAAARTAAILAGNLGVSLERAMGIMRLKAQIGQEEEVILDPRDPRYDPIAAEMARNKPDTVSPFDPSRLPKTPSGGRRGGGGGGAAREQEDYLKNLLLEAEQKRKLVGLSEDETRRQEILFELKKRELPLNDARIEQIIQTEAQTRLLMEAEEKRQQLMQTVEGHIENAFMSWVDGSASVEDAFKGMLRNIILAIYQQQVAEPAARAVGGLLAKAIPFLFKADGGAFNKGVEFFANGGVVGSPTMFQHSGGLGVMGEAGPEAIMPLKRGSDGKLGVQMQGGGGGDTINVHQYFQLSANGDESVRRIVRQEAPRMAEMAKSAVVDAKRRGGSYGRSF